MGEWEYGNMGEYLERVALITVMVGMVCDGECLMWW